MWNLELCRPASTVGSAPPAGGDRCLILVHGVELVAFRISHDPPTVLFGQHRGAQLEELVQVSLVSEPDVDVHAVLRGLGFG